MYCHKIVQNPKRIIRTHNQHTILFFLSLPIIAFSSDEEFVSPTKEADLSKAKPEFMSAKPEPTLAMSGINRVFHKGQFVSGKDFSPDVVIPFSNVVDETANLMKQQGY